MPPVKKLIPILVIGFLVYAVFTAPSSAATMVGSAWDVVAIGAKNVFAFLDLLISRS